MSRIASGAIVFAIFFAVSAYSTIRHGSSTVSREPSSYENVRLTVEKVKVDLDDSRIFNEKTATAYINQFADQAYGLESHVYTPSAESEAREFLKTADATVKTLFAIRLRLAEKLAEFELRNKWTAAERIDAVSAFRRAQLYLRYAEDFVITWRHRLQPLRNSAVFFAGEGPLTLRNPKYFGVLDKVTLRAGDVLLVRGDSFISATISRIGDVVTNMSHLAMVAEAEDGRLHVVEALMEKGLIQYDLDRFLSLERLPRAAVYRYRESGLAKVAARNLWKLYLDSLRNPQNYRFDIQMDPNDHSKVYCAEAVRMAWESASNGQVIVPRYLTTFHGAIETDFAKGVQMQVRESFAPSDIEVDTRFTLIAEHRDLTLLDSSRRYDVVLSSLFEKFKQGFTYKPDLTAGLKGVFGIFARNLGFMTAQVPADATVETLTTLIRHKNLVTELVPALELAEKKVADSDGRPLSYRELEALFEKTCGGDCVELKSEQLSRIPLAEVRGTNSDGRHSMAEIARCEALFRRVD